jgi:arabinofuranosyltransferase
LSVNRIRVLVLTIAGIFSVLFYFNAYVCDDAFISFRVVDNLVRGHGFRWNVAERVQVFTAPLFTLMMSVVYWPIHDRAWLPNPEPLYLASMVVSYALSLSGILFFFVKARDHLLRFLVFLLLMSSKAFVTFTSSGLETPLIYLLILLFYVKFLWDETENRGAAFTLLLLAALAVVNRLDTALLLIAPCIYLAVRRFRADGRKFLLPLACASLPVVLWFGFALVYFGFLLPNPYYARVVPGVDPAILSEMGWAYFLLNLRQDPITLTVISLGIALSLLERRTALAGASNVAYLVYVGGIGGDFVGFRFLAPAFLLSSLLICRFFEKRLTRVPSAYAVIVAAAFLSYGVLTPDSPLRAYRDVPRAEDVRYYFQASRLANWRPGRRFPFQQFHRVPSFEQCRDGRASEFTVEIAGGGLAGFCRGPRYHYVAPAGITDPLIARLPVEVDTHFYPGHLAKPIPAGYVQSVHAGENRIRDEGLSAYYERIVRITRGPLFGKDRWRDILALNFTGQRRYSKPYVESVPPLPPEFTVRHPSNVDRLRSDSP